MSTTDRPIQATGTTSKSAAMRLADTVNGEHDDDDSKSTMRVLLAVDDSDESLRVARTAHQMFRDHAKYWAVNVGPYQMNSPENQPLVWGVAYPLVLSPEAEEAPFRRAEAAAKSVCNAAGLPDDAVPIGVVGDPAAQICRVAKEHAIDVIVIGARSGSWLRHLFEPSVTKAVVREAERPVLVVP